MGRSSSIQSSDSFILEIRSIYATSLRFPFARTLMVESRAVKRPSFIPSLVLVLALFLTERASAQVYTERSYILPQSSVELTGTPARPIMADMNISDDQPAFDPFTLPVH